MESQTNGSRLAVFDKATPLRLTIPGLGFSLWEGEYLPSEDEVCNYEVLPHH